MLTIAQLLTLVTAVSGAAINVRDAAKVLADLQTINTDNDNLHKAVDAYSGGIASAIGILNTSNQLDKDIKSATSDAQAAGAASEADAQSIIDYINNTLEPGIASTVQALEGKKAQFDKDGLTSTVHDQLVKLKGDTDSLGAALIADAPDDLKDSGNAAQAKIDGDFQGAIDFFSS
ncbi:hypothetical protein VHEMI01605 [[Torrubiella] hemipterigena]|uniref:Hydrophobic surface binding protein A n=1 Tax=[Torrubiella] hemipterigena TaxID=1531966 RepID=A0A0A1SMC4_9HYPO|nr:hypothetical protein VHEMI01605 [[Torrubiella] hemipterigena]